MSIVNKMLQDLEQREADSQSANFVPPNKSSGFPRWLLLALTLALISALAAWYYQQISALTENVSLPTKLVSQGKQSQQSGQVDQAVQVAQQAGSTAAPIAGRSVSSEPQKQPQVATTIEVDSTSPSFANTTNTSTPAVTSVVTEQLPRFNNENIANEAPSNNDIPPSVTASQPSLELSEPSPDASLPTLAVKLAESPQVARGQTASRVNEPRGEFVISRSDTDGKQRLYYRYEAKQAIANNQIDKAITALKALVKLDPKDFLAVQKLSQLQYRDSPQVAIVSLQQGLIHSPQAHSLRLLLAKAQQRLGQDERALESLLGDQPDIAFNDEYYALQGLLAQQLQRFEVAYQSYFQLAAYQPQQSQWWLGLAIALDNQQHFSDALEAYRKVLDLGNLEQSVLEFVENRISQLRS